MMDAGKLDATMSAINEQAGLFLLGRHTQNQGDKQAALRKGFGPWKGRGNTRTKGYRPYVDWYADQKKARGQKYWHIVSGDLHRDAIDNARVIATPRQIRIKAAAGRSRPYAAAQNFGSSVAKIPPRPFYDLDQSDMKKLSIFYQNRLTQAFGMEARFGKTAGR